MMLSIIQRELEYDISQSASDSETYVLYASRRTVDGLLLTSSVSVSKVQSESSTTRQIDFSIFTINNILTPPHHHYANNKRVTGYIRI